MATPVLVAVTVVPDLRGLTAGLSMGLLPAAGGAAFLAVHAVGERTWPRPTGAVRRAPLAREGSGTSRRPGSVRWCSPGRWRSSRS